MGLGAALLIAALLLSTYTKGKIAKIPLNLDTTLVADGTGTAFDPESLNTDRFVINRNIPVSQQEQISVESPSNADVVTLQVGNTLRRTDKQQDNGLLLALVDTVTVDRKTATAVSSESNPGGAVQKPCRRRTSPYRTTGWLTGFLSIPRSAPIPFSTRSPRRRMTPTTTARKTSTG
jgi:hypothetical protein